MAFIYYGIYLMLQTAVTKLTTFAKIRILLALLCASLLLTAIIIHNSYTPHTRFIKSAHVLEENLHKKERIIETLFNDKEFEQLQNLPEKNSDEALRQIEYITIKNRIWLDTYKDGQLTFWTGIKIIPESYKDFKEGRSFIKEPNGYYEVIRKTKGSFTAIASIFVKSNFKVQNQYLKNDFEPILLKDNSLQIADLGDKDVFHIHDLHNKYLFSVKLDPKAVNYSYVALEFTLWVAGILTLCLLVSSICNYLIHIRKVLLAFLFLAGSIILIRFVNLYLHLPDFSESLQLFSPKVCSLNKVFPTLGDFCINIISLFWLVVYVYNKRTKILRHTPSPIAAYALFIGGIALLVGVSTGLMYLFQQLVVGSNISFDVNNVLNLSGYSMLGVVMACFGFLIFYLLVEILLVLNTRIAIKPKTKLIIFAVSILLTTAVSLLFYSFTLFYIQWAALVLIRVYANRYDNGELNAVAYISMVLLCAWICAIKLNYFEFIKEQGTRKELTERLVHVDNPKIKRIFQSVEKHIVNDPYLIHYFKEDKYSAGYLKSRFQKLYFDGYLSDYECKVYEFDSKGQPVSAKNTYMLDVFKEMVVTSSFKLSNYFYRENERFGFQSYFAILPVYEKEVNLGTVIVELKSKPIHSTSNFPELLIDKQLRPDERFKNYSYAFYSDGKLLSQNGDFNYNVVNTNFKGKLNQYLFKLTDENKDDANQPFYHRFTQYSHLIYQPSQRKVIVVSRLENKFLEYITSLTFFFVVLLLFSAFIIIFAWLWNRITFFKINTESISWKFELHFEHLLYRTRIQFSMIFSVVFTLVLVGVITYISITGQYQEQQEDMISNKTTAIAAKFENLFNDDLGHIDESTQVKFNNFADNYSTDLILFNTRGVPVLSTQPKIYDYGIIGRRMHAKAFVLLHLKHKSMLINEEKIGGLTYKTAYVPVRDAKYNTIAYLQLPYFSNQADYNERIGSFLNAMINIYAFIFLAIGMFAVLIARQITTPLSFIQHNLSKTIYGKKNEPIKWERHDEIGALVKEYNKMIAALENSANRLAQSERESAWREMAKQVAHEIKNPLTPLKLGLQLLEKSWRDKDPKFDLKFERFSKSFVEQIESLSSIASEFSAFAKMPDTKMERISVFEMLGQAVIIFKHMDNVRINYEHPEQGFMVNADRDQLLRCFNNLLKNAIEAMPPERVGVIDISHTINRNSILLKIQDNGNGIPENLRERIFEPNFTTKSSGTGLGLAFVKNSIENAGGKVWYETIIGEGTTFYLNFPESKI